MVSESKVTVARTSPDDVKQRQVILKLNGEPFATLMYGKTATKSVEPGHHTLRADNTWNKKTIEFDLAPGEHTKFRVVNRAGRFTWWLVAALGAGPMYVSIEREP
jgi:hypothetical protein